MRYATFSLTTDPAERLGLLLGDSLLDVHALVGPFPESVPNTLVELIRDGPESWARLAARIADALASRTRSAASIPADTVRWHAPIPRPAKNIVGVGFNYASSAPKGAQSNGREATIPKYPVFFTKAPTTTNGPYDAIEWHPSITQQVDWEVELGVVIGVGGKNISRHRALDHVFGYTVVNDISARDVQARHIQWFKGKSLDGCCPMGPVVVTADEFGDPQTKTLTLRVNGVQKQHSTTAHMTFPVEVIIESLSQGMTIDAGDIITTGTPEGIGLGRRPREFLKNGDVIETEIEGIGTMRNTIVCVSSTRNGSAWSAAGTVCGDYPTAGLVATINEK